MKIPFSKPHIPKSAIENVVTSLTNGRLCGDGPCCHKVEEKIKKIFKIKHSLLTTSCTHALEMSMLLLNAKEGSEVILPSFTFTSTANSILVAGLKPVFCEIDPLTMNMDMNDVAKRITPKTCAIFPVHYAGVACDMEKLYDLIKGTNIKIIEDAAQAIGAKWRGKYLGTLGHMAAFSFHETKNVVCGEGGVFLTNDDAIADSAQIIREKGTNRLQFLKGQVDKYTWVAKGSSYVLADPLAALLDAELDIMDDLNKKRGFAYHYYNKHLKELSQKNLLTLPNIPQDCETNYHIFHLILPTASIRNSLMSYLREREIGAVFHYVPLHSSPEGQKLGNNPKDLSLTEEYSNRLLRLPIFSDITEKECEYVVSTIYDFFSKI